jgi:hypothetical protein
MLLERDRPVLLPALARAGWGLWSAAEDDLLQCCQARALANRVYYVVIVKACPE